MRRGREAAGLTQVALAEGAGMSVRMLGELESGRKVPTLFTMALLSWVLARAVKRRVWRWVKRILPAL